MSTTGLNNEIKDKLREYVNKCFEATIFIYKISNFTMDLNLNYIRNNNIQTYIITTIDQYKTLYIDFVNIFFVELYKKYSRTTNDPTGIPQFKPETDANVSGFLVEMQAFFAKIPGFSAEVQLYTTIYNIIYTYTTYSNAIQAFLAQNNPAKYSAVLDKINGIPYAPTSSNMPVPYYNRFYNKIVYWQIAELYQPANMFIAIYRRVYDQIRMEQDLEIYRQQLAKEKTPEMPNELSKKIIKLMLDENQASISEVLQFLHENQEAQTKYFGKPFVSQIAIASIDNILAEDTTPKPAEIQIPKLVHKDISQATLTKLIGLCNPDLYNLLQNADLGLVAFNKKKYYGFENDLRFKTRKFDQHTFKLATKITAIPEDFKSLASSLTYVNDKTALGKAKCDIIAKCIANEYHLDYYLDKQDNKYTILFTRNSICDIDFSQQEIDTFKANLDNATRQGKRYFFTYGSTISFKKAGFTEKIHGGAKVSLIIDTLKRQIFFFKPMGLDTYAFYNIHTSGLDNMIYYLLPIYLMLNIDSLAGYTFIVDANISPQYIEFNLEGAGIGAPATAITQANFSTIFSGNEPEFQDWSFGYCGLWNYLYIFLLVINPMLDICNIYNFLKALSAQQHKEHLIKLLLRNFAAHIEQALKSKYVIPIQSLKLDQLTASTTLDKLRLNSNNTQEIALRKLTKDNIAKLKPGTEEIKDHPILQGKVPGTPLEIYRIIKGYSAYILAKGKHVLYDDELIQFINLDDNAS